MKLTSLFQSRVDFLQLMINAQRGVDIRDVGEDADVDESTVTKSKKNVI